MWSFTCQDIKSKPKGSQSIVKNVAKCSTFLSTRHLFRIHWGMDKALYLWM